MCYKLFLIIFLILLITILSIKILNSNESFKNKNSDFKIVMFLTEGLNKEAENCIQTLKNNNLDKKLLVTALDDGAYSHIHNLGVNTQLKKTNLKKEADFGTKDFFEITINKLDIIKDALEKYNQTVVYTDTDIVFLKDISEDVQQFNNSDFDIMIQNDVANFDESKKNNYCTGFIFFKPNKMCIDILKESKQNMNERWNSRGKNDLADQKSFNHILKKKPDLKIKCLSLKDYPNGSRYFKNLNTVYKNYTPKIVHNNYIVGTSNKINRFKKHNLWFVN